MHKRTTKCITDDSGVAPLKYSLTADKEAARTLLRQIQLAVSSDIAEYRICEISRNRISPSRNITNPR